MDNLESRSQLVRAGQVSYLREIKVARTTSSCLFQGISVLNPDFWP